MPGNGILHFGGVQIRVVGSGNLRLTLYSLNQVNSSVLSPIAMSATTDIIPLKLANFNTQRAMLKVETTAIDEQFDINDVTMFVKEIYSGYPQ